MRVLWVCNIMLPEIARQLGEPYSVREGWLSGVLGRFLREDSRGIVLGICFPAGGELASFGKKLCLGEKRKEVFCYGFGEDLSRPEQDDPSLGPRFGQILSDFLPDVVHIFGTEFPHAYACAKVWNQPAKTLVGIQGICGKIAEEYMADLPVRVQESRTLRDVLRKDSIKQQQEKFLLRGQREEKLLRLAGHIAGRTGFDREYAYSVNPRAVYHKLNETMRDCFYEGGWDLDLCRKHRIFLTQGDYPLKGFHYLLQAMQEILQDYPDTVVSVAGNSILGTGGIKSRLKIPAYGRYLRRLICKNRLQDRVEVLGPLQAEEMKKVLLESHVFVCPSAVENSPNSVAEAQLLGLPVAASRAGGIPSVVEDKRGGLLFEKGNPRDLARAVKEIFSSDGLARSLSKSERQFAAREYDPEHNYQQLMEAYREIL